MDAMKFFNDDYALYAPVIDMIKAGEAEVTACYPFGVELKHHHDMLILCLNNDEDIEYFLPKINTGILTVFYGASDNGKVARIVTEMTRIVPCHQMIYTKKEPPRFDTQAEFKQLDESYAEFVYANYTRRGSDSGYIHELCRAGVMYGMFINGQIVGFAGRHSDGSMGFLEVLPAFRRHGYGRQIACFTIGVLLKEGRLPFAHIVEGNDVSLALNGSIEGMVPASRFVSWISTKK